MFRASIGGRDAARWGVYRHALVRIMMPLLGPLHAGYGWSALSLTLGAILMGWQSAPTLMQRFDAALATLDAALPRRRRTGRTYQGFIKALGRLGPGILETLRPHLRERVRAAAGACWKVGRFVPIAADGSKFNGPRTIANEALGFAGKDKSGPQMLTLLLIHLGTMLPWAWKNAGAADSERSLLRSLLDLLPDQTLLVADAGFTGFDLLSGLRRRGVHFLVRVGSNVRLLTELGYYRREGRHTVYLWPNDAQSRLPLVLRLIRVKDVYLITDVTDPRELSQRTAADLYRRRWGIEIAFRSLKQTLERRAVRSGTAAHALAELDWALTGLQVLTLLGVQHVRAAGHPPRRLSPANAVAAVRRAQRSAPALRTLRGALRRCVRDAYRRTSSKRSYRWPRKKAPPTLSPPELATASPAQVQKAAALRRLRPAA